MADAAKKYKISTPNHTRNYIDFDIDDSRIEFRKNDLDISDRMVGSGKVKYGG